MVWMAGGAILLLLLVAVLAARRGRLSRPGLDPAQSWLTGAAGDPAPPGRDDPADGGGPDTAGSVDGGGDGGSGGGK